MIEITNADFEKYLLFFKLYTLDDNIDDELFTKYIDTNKSVDVNILSIFELIHWTRFVSDKTDAEKLVWCTNLIYQIANLFGNNNTLVENDYRVFAYYLFFIIDRSTERQNADNRGDLLGTIQEMKDILALEVEKFTGQWYCQETLRYYLVQKLHFGPDDIYIDNIAFLREQLPIVQENREVKNRWYEQNIHAPI